jgi:TetR/AcrR family transcriptional repressor of nem operon
MPRVSKQQTESNLRAITEASSRLFRERGIKGVSVADLMAAAGLTHGGFYGHFESKEALAAAACRAAFEGSVVRWKARVAASADGAAARALLVERYVSANSRGSPGMSCPTAALAVDVAREPAESPVRAAFVAGNAALIDILASVQGAQDAGVARRDALADFATMVGALVLARATAGDAISDEFLKAGRERLVPQRRSGLRKSESTGRGVPRSRG